MPGVPSTRYAYLGPQGTFAHAALLTLAAATSGILVPQPTVSAAIEAIRSDTADAAVVPLENSIEGSVASTLDELADGAPLVVVREILLPVSFVVATRPETTPGDIATVATHPHAEAQCRRWLAAQLPDAAVELVGSTAGAAEAVAAGRYDAAVCAAVAADLYRLRPLWTDVADNPGAVTRFVVVARPAPPPHPTGHDRTSLVAFIRDNHTGALMEVLTEFATRGINLTRIESRPTKRRFGQYCFSLDCEGHVAEPRVGDALAALRRVCADVRFLGSYPRADDGTPVPPPRGRADADFTDAAAWLARLRDTGDG
ncbi:MAG: prephenate dehydratase [Mycobacteriales bacterium]